MVDFWSALNSGNFSCSRPNDFITTKRSIIIGCSFFLLTLANFLAHFLLISVIFYSWKATFRQFFVYRLIITMNCMAIVNMLIHFGMTIPCTISGCLSWPTWLIQFLTCFYRSMEYGFFITVTFIAVDRFFSFYFQYFGKKFFQTIYTIVIICILAFLSEFVLFIFGCPKIYDVIEIGVFTFCTDCKIFGISWDETARKIIYLLPYPMIVLYLLIIIKIVAMRYKFYNAKKAFSKDDQILPVPFLVPVLFFYNPHQDRVIQFSILCGIQYALSFVENYFEEGPDNYNGLVLMSIPFFVQISNALALLLTNRLVRKALKLLIFRTNADLTKLVTAFVHNNSNITRVNGTKNQRAVKLTQTVKALRTVERPQVDRLEAAIKAKRSRKKNHIVFHHDNARPHVEGRAFQSINDKGWDLLKHPPYSSTETPTDYYVDHSLKNWQMQGLQRFR